MGRDGMGFSRGTDRVFVPGKGASHSLPTPGERWDADASHARLSRRAGDFNGPLSGIFNPKLDSVSRNKQLYCPLSGFLISYLYTIRSASLLKFFRLKIYFLDIFVYVYFISFMNSKL